MSRRSPSTPANEASDGVSLREQIQQIVGYCGNCYQGVLVEPDADGDPSPVAPCPCTKRVDDILSLIHHHDQRIIAEAERRAKVDQIRWMISNAEDELSHEKGYANNAVNTTYYENVLKFLKNRYELSAQQDGQGEQRGREE